MSGRILVASPLIQEIIITFNDGSEDGEAVNAREGDLVDIKFVKVLILETDSPDAEILKEAKLEAEFRQLFGTANRYNIDFRPTFDGAYGFWIKGRVQERVANEDANPGPGNQGPVVNFEELFICGGGTLDIDPATNEARSQFSCVSDLQPFPASFIWKKTGVDVNSYRDGGKFRLQKNEDGEEEEEE